MTLSFVSNLTLEVKGYHAKQTMKKQYVLNSAEPFEMLNHAMHMTGIQGDAIAATRVAVTDNATFMEHPPDKGSITVSSTTKDSNNTNWHSASVTWNNLTSDQIDTMLGAIAARLKAVGVDI